METIYKLKEWTKRNTLIIMIIVATITFFIIEFIQNFNFHKLEKLNQLKQWFFATPTSMTAIISIAIALAAYNFQRQEKRKMNSYILADRYANEVLPRYRFILYIYNQIEADKYVHYFKNAKSFDGNELRSLFQYSETSLNEIKELFKNIDQTMIYNALELSGIGKNTYLCYNINVDSLDYTRLFNNFVLDLLNNLEAMCLMLYNNLADEKIIYQSLHQTFIKLMPLLYLHISEYNTLDDNRYYTNVIWLYNKWTKRKMEQTDKTHRKISLYRGTPL